MSPVIQAAIRAVMPAAMRDRAVRAAADALVEAWPVEEPPWLATMLRSCTASLQQHAGTMLLSGGCHPLLLRAGQSLVQARLTGSAVGVLARARRGQRAPSSGPAIPTPRRSTSGWPTRTWRPARPRRPWPGSSGSWPTG